jgi:hypothetical protein
MGSGHRKWNCNNTVGADVVGIHVIIDRPHAEVDHVVTWYSRTSSASVLHAQCRTPTASGNIHGLRLLALTDEQMTTLPGAKNREVTLRSRLFLESRRAVELVVDWSRGRWAVVHMIRC